MDTNKQTIASVVVPDTELIRKALELRENRLRTLPVQPRASVMVIRRNLG